MAFSIQRAVSDGTMTLLPVSIEYFDRSEIQVAFDDVVSSTGWSWVGATDKTLAFSPAVPNGVEVSVIRTTDLSELRHQYALGAQFTAESMDESFKQVLHIAQEAAERQLGGDFFTDVNMHGYQIQNLGPATAPDHAVTLQQYQADANGASASKDIAVAAAVSASNSTAAAGASATSASASASAASTSASAASASESAAASSASSASASASTATAKAAEAVVSASDAAASAAAASVSEANAAASAAAALHQWEVEGRGIHYDSGNVRIGGVGARITGDFSNATVANRVMFQTSTVNSNTSVGVIPNGTGMFSQFDAYSFSDPSNSSIARLRCTATDVQIVSGANGTGTYLPMAFYTGGSERMRIDANGNVGIGQDPGNWYGVATRFVAVQNQNDQSNFGIGNSAVGAAAKVAWRMIGGTVNSFLDQVLGDNNGSPSFLFSYGTAVQYTAFSLGGAERLRIAASGAFGLGGANYGTAGQVLTSGGEGVAPSWTSPAGLPAGAVAHFAMSTAPSGWLKANGALVSRTTYAALFAAIGTTFGTGDGSTTFALPDLRGEFIRGLDDGRGVDSARGIGTAQASQNLSHSHGAATGVGGGHSHTVTGTKNLAETGTGTTYAGAYQNSGGSSLNLPTNTAAAHSHTINADGGAEARPRNVAMLACIKF